MFTIRSISSLNLRRSRGTKKKEMDDPISFSCSVCLRKLKLGRTSGMMAKIAYTLNDKPMEVQMCELCSDVFCDVARYGPRVISELSYWSRKSVVSRMSLVQQYGKCFNCLEKLDTHIFLKYDDLRVASRTEVFDSKRLCAKCVISYLSIMLASKSIAKAKLPLAKSPKYGEINYEF